MVVGLNGLPVPAQGGAAERIGGRERNQRAWPRQLGRNVGVARRVNSTVGPLFFVMAKAPIEAIVVEINDGPFFEVTFHALPRTGELIHLYSIVDARAHKQADYFYEVVQVLHKL